MRWVDGLDVAGLCCPLDSAVVVVAAIFADVNVAGADVGIVVGRCCLDSR